MYVDTVLPNELGVFLGLTGEALFPCRVEFSIRLVHHDGKPVSTYLMKGATGGVVFEGRNSGRGFRIAKNRLSSADSPYVKVIQAPAEANDPHPVPVADASTGLIDLTVEASGSDADAAVVEQRVATFVASFRFLPMA